MLVLLVIFMVATPLIEKEDDTQRKVDINLPVTRNNANQVDPEQTEKLILAIDERLQVTVGEELIVDCSEALGQTERARFEPCFEAIEKKLGANVKLQEEKELYLLADTEIPYGFVVGTMARIKAAGVNKLGMVTNPEYLDEQPEAKGGGAAKKAKKKN